MRGAVVNDEGYVKNVGWRKIYDIKWFKRKNVDICEGYYLRHSKYLFEDGYQKVRVRCVIDRRLDDN
jgi:hypothetical protein